jgi:hypothetical protein
MDKVNCSTSKLDFFLKGNSLRTVFMYVYNCSSGVSAQGQTNEHTHMVAHLEFQTEDRTSEEHTHKHTRVYGCRKMHIYIYIWIKRADVYSTCLYAHDRSLQIHISGAIVVGTS